VATVALLVAGCTWSSEEPGLFSPQPSEPASGPSLPIRPTNPELPVAGDAVWTTSEGLRVTSRYAVHAVRRIPGATVLDWSVTPLAAPGLAPGDLIPSWVDLGLTRQGQGDISVLLLDLAHGRAYRPLNHRSRQRFNHCLCSPTWVAQLDLRIGDTRLLQATYPELPASVDRVDVSLANLPVFPGIPVTAEGQVPTATQPTDLQRPAERRGRASTPYTLVRRSALGQRRVYSVAIDVVQTSVHLTTMQWTVRSLAEQPRFSLDPAGEPLAAAVPEDVLVVSPEVASGPVLQSGGTSVRALWMTATVQDRGYWECLCSTFGLWARSLRQPGGRATVTTLYPALPADTRTVDVVLPGATTLWRLPVSPAPEPAALGPAVSRRVRTWTYDEQRPPRGWTTDQWPTPVPDPAQLDSYEAFSEKIGPLPRR
jgi:hypothetical protein